MSYYILPKNINNINVNPKSSYDSCNVYLSYSLINYYDSIKQQVIDMFSHDPDLSNNSFDSACKLVNPYEFIFSKVPGSKFSVSKLKPKSNIFYDLLEISSNLNIFDSFKITQRLQFLHISSSYQDSIECIEIFRDNYPDNHLYLKKFDIDNNEFNEIKFEFLFCETNSTDYFISLVETLIIILRNQKFSGTSIIKIKDIFHKPVLDILYLLSSLYEKVYICKPNTNNIVTFDRYIVCKNFLYNEESNNYLKLNYLKLIIFLKKLENKHIVSILDFEIPYYFKNKIDDLNIIIGQQQLETLNLIINLYKNKNKNDKFDSIKKNNIQKSVSWCEKYKIPCNKFTEKINIFLPIISESNLTYT
jgi:hypothetical protein